MAFQQETNLTKVGIEDFEIALFVPGPGNTEGIQAAKCEVQILISDGTVIVREFNLLERLGDDAPGLIHLSNLANLRDYIRVRLNAEVLP